MFVSFLTYTTLFLWARGNIITNGRHLRDWKIQRSGAMPRLIILSEVTWKSVDLIAYVLIVLVVRLPQSTMLFTGTPLFSP